MFTGADRLIGDSRGATIARLVFGVVLVAEGLVLSLNRWGARRRLVERVLRTLGRHRLWRMVFSPIVWVLGALFVVLGVTELVRAAQEAL